MALLGVGWHEWLNEAASPDCVGVGGEGERGERLKIWGILGWRTVFISPDLVVWEERGGTAEKSAPSLLNETSHNQRIDEYSQTLSPCNPAALCR